MMFGRTKVRLVKGDITLQETDAVVNAANSSLMGGGGVDGAIHRAGGPAILSECMEIRKTRYPDGLPTGEAVITCGGSLRARHVIHTVGPVWRGGGSGEEKLLAEAYRSSLRVAYKNGLRSVAFPSISTGAYGYPIKRAARIALGTVKAYLEETPFLDEVVFTVFSEGDQEVYSRALAEL
jgi:O-acetyl-ADP-ribose deacetylase (regulator of RNase III)